MAARDLRGSIVAVLLGTAASGLVGGLLGGLVAAVAPGFVAWIQAPAAGDGGIAPGEFGVGLGAAFGLLLGSVGCTLLACAHAWRGGAAGKGGDGDRRGEEAP